MELKTIRDCVEAAKEIRKEAAEVTTREEHAAVWDKKVEVLKVVNNALETGYWQGLDYDELWCAKHFLYEAAEIAGRQAQKTYFKGE